MRPGWTRPTSEGPGVIPTAAEEDASLRGRRFFAREHSTLRITMLKTCYASFHGPVGQWLMHGDWPQSAIFGQQEGEEPPPEEKDEFEDL